MEKIKWCCVNEKFGNNRIPMFMEESMKWKRTDSIAWFIQGTGKTWRHWKTIGWRCVKVKMTLEII